MDAADGYGCLDARRDLLAEPRLTAAPLQRHLGGCPHCAAYRDELLAQDERVAAAAQVRVPEGLAERVLLRHGAASRALRRMALAAAVVLALGVAGGLGAQRWQQAPAREAIAHVLEEEPHELLVYRRAEAFRLAAAARTAGISLDERLVEVRYLGTCPFRGGYAHHVLLGTPFGKATLLLTPDAPLRSTAIAESRGMAALASPARTGNVFLVADSADALKRIASLVWR